jgi:pimeloyl-ACP methyl ester carboxylesterase
LKRTMRWLILPGMGATAAMYNGLKHKLGFQIDFLNWPAYRGEKTYADVARRIIKEQDIVSEDVVGGSSLGGMVALEIARLSNVKAVVLLGSAVNRKEVQTLLAMLSPLATAAPMTIIQTLVGKNQNLVSTMFADSDPEFIRAMCSYLPSWPGYDGPVEKVFRLHGKKDHVIPRPATGCEVVETAGHLLAITHATETAAFLQGVYEQVAGK